MARNIQPNEMVGSVLFTTIAPKIHSISSERLLFELCIASTTTDVRSHVNNLNAAIAWDNTPQRYAYWSKLYFESRRAGV